MVTVKVQEQIGLRRTIEVARRLGVESPLDENLSLALGTSDLTLLELTSAYGALANQGKWMPPTAIRYVLDAQGKLLEENTAGAASRWSRPRLAYVITHMLRGTIERGTGAAAKALGRPVAAKTGTTNDYSNAWFIGYTPQLATGRVGRLRPAAQPGQGRDRLPRRGARSGSPSWARCCGDSPKEDFPMPERVVLVPVDLDAVERVRAGRHDGLRRGHRAGGGVRAAPTRPAVPGAPRGAGCRRAGARPPRLAPAPRSAGRAAVAPAPPPGAAAPAAPPRTVESGRPAPHRAARHGRPRQRP